MKTISTMYAALAALLLSACASFVGPGDWREEVALPDGRTIIVTRAVSTGNPYDQVPESWKLGPPVRGHVIRIPIPESDREAVWKHDASLTPLAIHIIGKTIFLATSPSKCEYYDQYGRPVPPYLFFAYEGSQWKPVSTADFPPDLNQANLLIVSHSSAVEFEYYAARTIRNENSRVVDGVRTIHRSGIKGFELCASRLKARDQSKTKGDNNAK